MKFSIILGILLIVGNNYCQGKLKISIYYSTLCPDSMRFFRFQFNPIYKDFLPYLKMDFVPYGKAYHIWEESRWNIQCQHGQKECVGNRYHACELNRRNGHDKDVHFITCSMISSNPTSHLLMSDCADDLGISFEPIDDCFRNGESHDLLVQYGERTQALKPKLSYVPTIIFNDAYNATVQKILR